MNARGWCLVGIRAVGFLVLIVAVPAFLAMILKMFLNPLLGIGQVSLGDILYSSSNYTSLSLLSLGLYLFFGGKWVARQITRGIPIPGTCPGCGYDIRGMEGGRCPECGAKIVG